MAANIKPSRRKPVAEEAGPSVPEPTTPITSTSKPKYLEIIEEALNHLSDRNGSSAYAIKKFMASKYGINTEKNRAFINTTLKKALSEGKLLQTKGKGAGGSFKLPPKRKAKITKEKKTGPTTKPTTKPTNSKPATVKSTVKSSKTTTNAKQAKVIPATPKVAKEKKKQVRRISVVPTPKATLAKPPQNRNGKPAGKRILKGVNKAVKETKNPPTPKFKVTKAAGHVGKIAKSTAKMNIKAAVTNVATKKDDVAVTKNQQSANDLIRIHPESDEYEPISGEETELEGNED